MSYIAGTADGDHLVGTDGNDTLNGWGGNDTLEGGKGDDNLYGDTGTDTAAFSGLIGDYMIKCVVGWPGAGTPDWTQNLTVTDSVGGRNGTDKLSGIEFLQFASSSVSVQMANIKFEFDTGVSGDMRGGSGNDTLIGSPSNDTLQGGYGNDLLVGGGGIDTVSYQLLDGTVAPTGVLVDLQTGVALTWLGQDTLEGIEHVVGTMRDDTLRGSSGPDSLDGYLGNDSIEGGEGDDSMAGGNGSVVFFGGGGNDSIYRTNYNPAGPGGAVAVYRGPVAEYSIAFGQGGLNFFTITDHVAGRDGADYVTFIDVLRFADGDYTPIQFALAYGSTKSGTNAADNIQGTIYRNHIEGLGGNDQLFGQASADTLLGGDGNDFLSGGDGDDQLQGGAGNDSLDGGPGIDVAIFSGASSNYTFSISGTSRIVTDILGSDGADRLNSTVERATFADKGVAFDIAGNAGMAAKLLGALAGPSAVHDPAAVALGLSLFDGGLTYEQVGTLAVDYLFAGWSTSAFVSHVYFDIVDAAPSPDVLAYLDGLIESGAQTRASLLVLGADTATNLSHIGFAGLAATGLAFSL